MQSKNKNHRGPKGPRGQRSQSGQRGRSKAVSNIDPQLLVKKAETHEVTEFVSKMSFRDFPLNKGLEKNIANKGYKRPTEIQEKSIPLLLEGNDLIGIAATGTGKTGAFLIPILERLMQDKSGVALVVVPTRELAQQVHMEFKSLSKGLGISSACYIGGTNINKDMASAKGKNRFIVGTPGRLNHLFDHRALRIQKPLVLVLDEFDRMLDMGFIHDVRKINRVMQNRHQTMLFSATIDPAQEDLIEEFVEQAIRVSVSSGTTSNNQVEQDIIKVAQSENKFDILLDLLNKPSFEKVILFAETKRSADKISKKLSKKGMKTDVIHGNKSQNYRSKAIKEFKSGRTKVLVATDVAARGIDIDNVSLVVNYQLPRTMDSYIHRIGRTGRAGKKGMAYTFVN